MESDPPSRDTIRRSNPFWVRVLMLCLCILAVSCSEGNDTLNLQDTREQKDLNAEEYHAQMESQENKMILGEFGILPEELRGWTIERVKEKIGEPDRVWDGAYGPDTYQMSNVPPKYRSGKFLSLVYTRSLGSLYVLMHLDNDQSTCILAQWLPSGSEF